MLVVKKDKYIRRNGKNCKRDVKLSGREVGKVDWIGMIKKRLGN